MFLSLFVRPRASCPLQTLQQVFGEGEGGYVPKFISKQKFAENLNHVLNLFPGANDRARKHPPYPKASIQ